jgi:hypothetical protein
LTRWTNNKQTKQQQHVLLRVAIAKGVHCDNEQYEEILTGLIERDYTTTIAAILLVTA